MRGIDHATPAILILIFLTMSVLLHYIRRAQERGLGYVRRIRGIDAIDEAAGRAAELGRPMAFSFGALTSVGPTLYAVLGVLHHVARKAARYRVRCIVPQNAPDVLPFAEDVTREAFREEGRLSSFDPRDIPFLSEEQFAYAAGYMGIVQRERVASAYLFGSFAAESLLLAEAGQQVGAMQVAASVSPEQVAFFICTCDYTLIGEELFAASAYLTREPVQVGSLYAQDRAKLGFLALLFVGVLIATGNSLWGWGWSTPDAWIVSDFESAEE